MTEKKEMLPIVHFGETEVLPELELNVLLRDIRERGQILPEHRFRADMNVIMAHVHDLYMRIDWLQQRRGHA